jgi:hypothetical protein
MRVAAAPLPASANDSAARAGQRKGETRASYGKSHCIVPESGSAHIFRKIPEIIMANADILPDLTKSEFILYSS